MIVTFDKIIKETDYSYLLRFGDESAWIPKSLCNIAGNNEADIPFWFLKERGLEVYADD